MKAKEGFDHHVVLAIVSSSHELGARSIEKILIRALRKLSKKKRSGLIPGSLVVGECEAEQA